MRGTNRQRDRHTHRTQTAVTTIHFVSSTTHAKCNKQSYWHWWQHTWRRGCRWCGRANHRTDRGDPRPSRMVHPGGLLSLSLRQWSPPKPPTTPRHSAPRSNQTACITNSGILHSLSSHTHWLNTHLTSKPGSAARPSISFSISSKRVHPCVTDHNLSYPL